MRATTPWEGKALNQALHLFLADGLQVQTTDYIVHIARDAPKFADMYCVKPGLIALASAPSTVHTQKPVA